MIAALAPVVECIAPAPAVTATLDPVVWYIGPALAGTRHLRQWWSVLTSSCIDRSTCAGGEAFRTSGGALESVRSLRILGQAAAAATQLLRIALEASWTRPAKKQKV